MSVNTVDMTQEFALEAIRSISREFEINELVERLDFMERAKEGLHQIKKGRPFHMKRLKGNCGMAKIDWFAECGKRPKQKARRSKIDNKYCHYRLRCLLPGVGTLSYYKYNFIPLH